MATKILVAQKRLFHNVFVCKDCSKKIRAQAIKVILQKVRCPRCGSKSFRPIRRK